MTKDGRITRLINKNLGSRHYNNAWDIAYMYALTDKVMTIKPVSRYIKLVCKRK